ncbi:unnamed protein product [Phaedon cochleariae]|uniref:Uncharacterized protein n=1 Tax=Phaedon cochleariae TaxID=80249 RepID=A0A9N9SIG7_PHACE|nr:unnamed protein product [Phaedon cochleariae]
MFCGGSFRSKILETNDEYRRVQVNERTVKIMRSSSLNAGDRPLRRVFVLPPKVPVDANKICFKSHLVNEDALLHDIYEFDRIHCQAQGRHFPGSYKTFSRNSNGFNEQDSSSSSAPERVGKQPEFLNTNPRIEEKETRKFTCYKCKGSKEKIIQSLINLEENCNNSIEKFIREIEIDRHLQVAALIDPGSAVCTIRESLVTSGQLISIDSSRKLFGFGQENPVNCQKKTLCGTHTKEDSEAQPLMVCFTKIILYQVSPE